jgi:hypothetical protein
MKNLILVFLIIIICVGLVSCKDKKKNDIYFNGEIIIIDSNVAPDTLHGEEIKLDGLYTGDMWAYDTLIGFIHHAFPDYFMHVFNIKTGEFLYPLCKRGEGPEEFPAITGTNQFVHENQLYLWMRKEFGKDECVLINMEKSGNVVKQKIDLRVEDRFRFSFVFVLNDSLFIANNPGEEQYLGAGSFIPPAYHLYNYHTKEKIKSYKLYNEFVSVWGKFFQDAWYMQCYASIDRIKPDKSKLAMGMMLMDQINIFDLTTGEIKGYKNKNSPEFDYLKGDPGKFKRYYKLLCVDDRYIYGLYFNNVINVFDWDGNFIKKIILDKSILALALDPVNKYLYINTIGEDDEEIYRYNVNYLYK